MKKKEWDLILKGCRENDRLAQELLYRHFFPAVERMIMKYTQDEDQILDIVNNGFLKVFQNIDQYQGHGSLGAWIRTIIFRSLSDYFRKSQRDFNFLIYPGRYPERTAHGITNGLYYDDLIQLTRRLNEKERFVFKKVCIEGYPRKEVAEELKLSESTCRWYLGEARKKLQHMIQNTAKQ